MSHEASLRAWKAVPKKSSHKFVLVAMAERAGENALCWPSIKRLELDTLLNRKTIISALDALESDGFIADTGERRGKTNQVKVYQLLGVEHRENEKPADNAKGKAVEKTPKNGTVKKESKGSGKSPKNNTLPEDAEQTQKRNSTKNGTVPDFPDKSTVFSSKESQKRDTESERNQKGTRSTDTDADAHEADAVDGEFEVCEPEQPISLPDDDYDADVQPGIFGSHLLRDCHPYLYWFVRDMEYRAERNPEALGDFAERLVKFGLEGSYCQASLNNFLRVRKTSLDDQILSVAREWGFESHVTDQIDNWAGNELEYIAEADRCLTEFREFLANQAA